MDNECWIQQIYVCIRISKGIRYYRNDGMKYGNYRRGFRVRDRSKGPIKMYWFRLYGLCYIGILVHDNFFWNILWIDMFCVPNRLKNKLDFQEPFGDGGSPAAEPFSTQIIRLALPRRRFSQQEQPCGDVKHTRTPISTLNGALVNPALTVTHFSKQHFVHEGGEVRPELPP